MIFNWVLFDDCDFMLHLVSIKTWENRKYYTRPENDPYPLKQKAEISMFGSCSQFVHYCTVIWNAV